jgi:hypothetical protein
MAFLLADKLLFKIKPRFFRSFSAMEKGQDILENEMPSWLE